ncbi:hypothetical protein FHU10_5147 [Serratia fonticola]|uniref:Uncharacterized protein n=1 Tax=Serratia fonticola TaxID=47917 RepID=A0A542D4H0_SERFO|nr:hypothetical protein [Serratia fonticola]TQI80002.1 hypothetical protein FHU09_2557 [Serratia fonticola]TQI97972.1 hypothetical protein FHU11_3489 [Serratia fonticola]TVZ72467.1 hypothetical protein FHU10_5147 [Serratia fonticola]
MEFDPRIVTVAIEVDGKLNIYSDLLISATGTKTANTLQNEFTVTITNLKKSVRDYLIKETSPLNRPRRRKKIILYAGRQSYGTFKVFEGDITQSSPSQPPDIGLTIKARTGSFFMTDILSTGYAATVPLEKVAADTAKSMDLTLDFQASDKNISNYSYTGAKLKQVDKLAEAGNYNVYVDDDRLVVKNADTPLTNAATTLNKNTGMIGMPEVTEEGVKVKYLLDPESRPGGKLTIESDLNPAANGTFVIFKLSYDISNRDTPFYNVAECRRVR